jgi:hypothetical protein
MLKEAVNELAVTPVSRAVADFKRRGRQLRHRRAVRDAPCVVEATGNTGRPAHQV